MKTLFGGYGEKTNHGAISICCLNFRLTVTNVSNSKSEMGDETNLEDIVVIEERVAMWRKELMQKGAIASLRSTITEMITDRFGTLPANITILLNNVTSEDSLKHIARSVYQSENLATFEQGVNALAN